MGLDDNNTMKCVLARPPQLHTSLCWHTHTFRKTRGSRGCITGLHIPKTSGYCSPLAVGLFIRLYYQSTYTDRLGKHSTRPMTGLDLEHKLHRVSTVARVTCTYSESTVYVYASYTSYGYAKCSKYTREMLVWDTVTAPICLMVRSINTNHEWTTFLDIVVTTRNARDRSITHSLQR